MKQSHFAILENTPLTADIYRMRLAGDTSAITAPGQFVNIRLDGHYLRRPISVCDWDDECLTLIYKIVGHGTEEMKSLRSGALDLLTGLGNGYDLTLAGDSPVLLGGGVGVAPLYSLARRLREGGRAVTVVLGFNTCTEIFYEDEFCALGCSVILATADGSRGRKGFVIAPMADINYSYFYACGPKPMLRAVCGESRTSGQVSLEERMGCGFGACMGCSQRTREGYKRICKDGPVLKKEEILWE